MDVGVAYSPIRYGGRRLNELFHCGPYEVKASKFLSFSALAASLPFNQPWRRQKMAQPSASNPPFRRPRVFFGEGEGEGPLKLSGLLPEGGGGLGGHCMEQGDTEAKASGCRRVEESLHGQHIERGQCRSPGQSGGSGWDSERLSAAMLLPLPSPAHFYCLVRGARLETVQR